MNISGGWVGLMAILSACTSAFDCVGSLSIKSRSEREDSAELESLNSLESSFGDCETCKLAVGAMREVIKEEKSDKEIKELAFMICRTLMRRQYPSRVCSGMINMYANETVGVFKRSKLTNTEFCTFAFEDCNDIDAPPFRWDVKLPNTTKPPVVPVTAPPKGSPTLRVLYLSDIHWDPQYITGSKANCKDPLCCREFEDGTRGGVRAGNWGMPSENCDLPLTSFLDLLQHVRENEKLDYIILTGDYTPHNVWNQTREEHIRIITTVFNLLKHYFPNTTVYPTLGNHEGIPVNAFPPNYVTGSESMSWLYPLMSKQWEEWVPGNENRKTINESGAFSIQVRPGFRIISVNMNYCPNANWWLMINNTDPNQHLAWLTSELQRAEDNKEKVHIIGHIPPDGCVKAWSWNYFKILLRYESTVTGQFFGHSHMDEFRVAFDPETNYKRATGMFFIGPSVTPNGGRNTAYRIYTIDGRTTNGTWAVLDHETYFMNVTEANILDEPIWRKEYTAKGFYGLKSLQPSEWGALIDRMETQDYLFQAYYQFMTRLYPRGRCDAKCKTKMLCDLRSARRQDPKQCQ